MSQILQILLPILLQYLPQLLNKPKGELSQWFDDGAKAALASKDPMLAFWMGSLKCATDGMDDQQYADVQRAAFVAGTLAKGLTESQAKAGGVA